MRRLRLGGLMNEGHVLLPVFILVLEEALQKIEGMLWRLG
jgi:hypothetical protein